MGNQCGKGFCDQEIPGPLIVVQSPYYSIVEKSKLIEDAFPEELIPETVKEKIKLLNLQFNPNRSEIWKYESIETHTGNLSQVVYTIVGKDSLFQKWAPQNSEQNIILNKSVPSTQPNHLQKKIKLDPPNFENALIFIFKPPKTDISNNSINSKSNSYAQNLTLQKVYYGPVNKPMQASQARVILQNGQYYQGNVYVLKFTGKGIMKNALGNHQYEGEWEDDLPNGHGIEILAGQFKYDGNFKQGKWHGHGILTLLNFRDQYSIEADFNKGDIEGSGKVFIQQAKTFNERDQQKKPIYIYEGSFKNGKQNGYGKWSSPNGQFYQGEFVNGQKEGSGVYTFRSGDCYKGIFKAGRPQGEGELIQRDRNTKGYWYKGENILVYKQGRM